MELVCAICDPEAPGAQCSDMMRDFELPAQAPHIRVTALRSWVNMSLNHHASKPQRLPEKGGGGMGAKPFIKQIEVLLDT